MSEICTQDTRIGGFLTGVHQSAAGSRSARYARSRSGRDRATSRVATPGQRGPQRRVLAHVAAARRAVRRPSSCGANTASSSHAWPVTGLRQRSHAAFRSCVGRRLSSSARCPSGRAGRCTGQRALDQASPFGNARYEGLDVGLAPGHARRPGLGQRRRPATATSATMTQTNTTHPHSGMPTYLFPAQTALITDPPR